MYCTHPQQIPYIMSIWLPEWCCLTMATCVNNFSRFTAMHTVQLCLLWRISDFSSHSKACDLVTKGIAEGLRLLKT